MTNRAEVRHYFVEGITARGYISLVPDMMDEWRRIYVLLGGPGTGKSTIIKQVGLELLERGYGIDFFRSAHEPDSMAGFLLPELGISMIDAMEIAPLRWPAPHIVAKFIDLSVFCDDRKLERSRDEIIAGERRMLELQFSLEEHLINSVNSSIVKQYYDNSGRLQEGMPRIERRRAVTDLKGPWTLAHRVLQQLQKSVVTPCFLHGLGQEGWINLAPDFLADCDQIRLEGEETLPVLNWLLREAQYLGQVIRIVLHPLNPDQMIGIVFPERNLAIWQGNPQELREQNIDGEFSPELKETLAAWQDQRFLLKNIYMNAVDFEQLDMLHEELLTKVLLDTEVLNQKE